MSDKKVEEKVIDWETILTKAEEISGISKADIGASYDAVIGARNKICEEHKSWLTEVAERFLVFLQPDLGITLTKRESHIEKDIHGNDITVPSSVVTYLNPSRQLITGFNADISLGDIVPAENKESGKKSA